MTIRWRTPLHLLAAATIAVTALIIATSPADAAKPVPATLESVSWSAANCDATYEVTVKKGGQVKRVEVQLVNWSGTVVDGHDVLLRPSDARVVAGTLDFGNGAGGEFLYKVRARAYGGGGKLIAQVELATNPMNSFQMCGLPTLT